MNTFFAVMAVLLFVTILGGVTGVLTVDKIKNLLGSSNLLPASQRITAQELQVIILREVKNVREYSVFRQNFEAEFDYHDDRKVFGLSVPLTNNDIKIHYKGEAVFGCDLSRAVFAEDSRSNRIKIIVPCGKILDIHHIAGTLEAAEKKSGIFSRETNLEKCDKELKQSLENMRRHLLNDGVLLQETNEKIRSSLKSLIAGINREVDAEIIFMGEMPANPRLVSG